jgi:hypothetical protein
LPAGLFSRQASGNHAICRLSVFIARLTSTHVPMGVPQFLHHTTVSLVGA